MINNKKSYARRETDYGDLLLLVTYPKKKNPPKKIQYHQNQIMDVNQPKPHCC